MTGPDILYMHREINKRMREGSIDYGDLIDKLYYSITNDANTDTMKTSSGDVLTTSQGDDLMSTSGMSEGFKPYLITCYLMSLFLSGKSIREVSDAYNNLNTQEV